MERELLLLTLTVSFPWPIDTIWEMMGIEYGCRWIIINGRFVEKSKLSREIKIKIEESIDRSQIHYNKA